MKRKTYSPVTELGAVNRELAKEDIITYLQASCRKGEYWRSGAAVATHIKASHVVAKQLLFELLTEGFLIARDGDTRNTDLVFSLKPELRNEFRRK